MKKIQEKNQNEIFLDLIDDKAKSMILESIAHHYGTSVEEVIEEVQDSEAENLLDYMVEPQRSAAYVLMQRHGFPF